MHVTIQESFITSVKPSASGQITKPSTSNNNTNTNYYKIQRNNISIILHRLFLGKALKNVLNETSKSRKNFEKFYDKICFTVTAIHSLPWSKFKKKSFFLVQVNANDHFVIQAGPTIELDENRAALQLLQLLIRSYDLCDKEFYNNICKRTKKQRITMSKPIQERN